MKYKKVTFIYSEEFITNKENLTKEELKRIFNNKYYNYIMRKEKYFFNTNDKEYRSLEKETIKLWNYR